MNVMKKLIWAISISAPLAAYGCAPVDDAAGEPTTSIEEGVSVFSQFKAITQTYVNTPAIDFGLPSSYDPISGDFDGDGKTDYGRVGDTGAWLYFGNGNGTFTQVFKPFTGLNFGAPHRFETIAGDFNGDGRTDYARLGDQDSFIFFGNSDRTSWQGYHQYKWGNNYDLHFGFVPSAWTTIQGDFNGDGKADYGRIGATGAWLYFGQSDGSFVAGFQAYDPAFNFGSPSRLATVTGDFNGDGRGDYARLDAGTAFIYYGQTNRTFSNASVQPYPNDPSYGAPAKWNVIAGDFDGDHREDFARLGDTKAEFFYARPDGTFTNRTQSYEGLSFGSPTTWQTIVGDFNGDGIKDYGRIGSAGGFFFYGSPAQTLGGAFETYPENRQNFGSPSKWQVLVGKFNEDKKVDYIRLGGVEAVVFLRRPNQPTGLYITTGFPTRLIYRWSQASDTGSITVNMYKNGHLYDSDTVAGDSTRETDFFYDATPLTEYCFALQAWNSGVESGWTSQSCYTVPKADDPPPPDPTPGVKSLVLYNCYTPSRPLEIYVADLTAQGWFWVDKGALGSQWANGGCPAAGQPWQFVPVSGHQYAVRAVDVTQIGCGPDVTSCWVYSWQFVGDSQGVIVPHTIG
jgi:hypothetical protein